MLSVGPWRGPRTNTPTLAASCHELRADGYNEVSAVPNYRESLSLDLDLEVSVWFNLEGQTALCLVGTLAKQELGWKLIKSMAAIIQN